MKVTSKLSMVVAGLVVALSTANNAMANTFVPATSLSWKQASGSQATSQQRLAGSVWQFTNNRFVAQFPNSAVGTVQGTVQMQGKVAIFKGQGQVGTGAGVTMLVLIGQLEVKNGVLVMTLYYEGSNVAAASINGIGFGSNGANIYMATITMRQVK